ncbi:MAG: S-layer homology domain-containing protein [Hyphomonadaceae bacterium]|nr:S-layer homology domain-containing protein [Clostridia bacterium]
MTKNTYQRPFLIFLAVLFTTTQLVFLPPNVAWGAPSSWAASDFQAMSDSGILSDNLKNPQALLQNITREEFADLIVRFYAIYQNQAVNTLPCTAIFGDTKNQMVGRANALGIIQGTSANVFSPQQAINRQEIAVMLTRALKKAFVDVTPSKTAEFVDMDDVAAWAKDSMSFCAAQGIINGVGDNRIAPLNTTTREQAIVLVQRVIKKYIPQSNVERYTNNKALKILPNGVANKAIRVALAGDSIPWGTGMLDDSYVAYVDDYVRTKLATTLLPSAFTFSGATQVINNNRFYKSSATMLSAQGSEVTFSLEGDELSIVQGIERTHKNASIIELLVDGVKYDEFSTFNQTPIGHENLTFQGNGKTLLFDLGRSFTYNHLVKRNENTLKGALNTEGYGATPTEDYTVIRKYTNSAGKLEVHHYVWLKQPLLAGEKLAVSFDYGESITYMKSAMNEVSDRFGAQLENRFGDGNDDYNLAVNPSISRGLDLRQTDERAVKTWQFNTSAKRTFTLRIKGLDPRVQGGTPQLILNLATNRFHHIMNAGIGGWTADAFNNDHDKLRNYQALMAFSPDIVCLNYGTNDDWGQQPSFAATRLVTGVTEDELRNTPTLWLKSSALVGKNYNIETSQLKIKDASANAITIDNTATRFDNVMPGDILVIGNYNGDNRKVATRLVKQWDATTFTATFEPPLKPSDMLGITQLTDLKGADVRIKKASDYYNSITQSVKLLRKINPDVKVALTDTGLSNYMTRLLIGYPLINQLAARDTNAIHISTYDALSALQNGYAKNATAYLAADKNNLATGASSYTLVNESNKEIGQAVNRNLLRNFSVKVDGVERYGNGCVIEGGYSFGFTPQAKASELIFDDWSNRSGKISYTYLPMRLKFLNNVPTRKSKIEVTYSTTKWSYDDCHIANNSDAAILVGGIIGEKFVQALKE